jgi:hypothetical protein
MQDSGVPCYLPASLRPDAHLVKPTTTMRMQPPGRRQRSARQVQTGVRRASRKSRCCFSVLAECGERLPASLQPAPGYIATITHAHSLTLQNPGSTRASRLTALLGLRQHVSAKHHLNGNATTNGSHAAHTITHTKAKIDTHVTRAGFTGLPNPQSWESSRRAPPIPWPEFLPSPIRTRQKREGPLADVLDRRCNALNGVRWLGGGESCRGELATVVTSPPMEMFSGAVIADGENSHGKRAVST